MKFARIIAVAVMVMSFASFALAQDVDVNVNATGGDAQAAASSSSASGAEAKSISNTLLINNTEEAKHFVEARTLQNFVTPVTPSTPLGWKALGCDFIVAEFTVGQLKEMAKGASFMKKRGDFWYAVLTDDVEYSILVANKTTFSDSTVVKLLVKQPTRLRNGGYLGEAEGVGRYGAPMGQIIGATVLGLIERTGSTQVLIHWDYLVEPVAMASTLGVGITTSNTNGSASSAAAGVAGSRTYNLTSISYRVKAQAFSGMGEEYFSCEAAPTTAKAVTTAPKCTPETIQRLNKALEKNRSEIKKCKKYSLNNLRLRNERAKLYWTLYECTGDREALNHSIENAEVAARNYKYGSDIRKNRSEADREMNEVHETWAKARKEVQK